jgi:hypothetical protein
MRRGWSGNEFFSKTMPREDHFKRYCGVIHLRTAAIGAAASYERWPRAHRSETIEEAAEIDELCEAAWSKHPHYTLVESSSDWNKKACQARAALYHILDEPVR